MCADRSSDVGGAYKLCVCARQVNLPDDRVIIVSGFLDDPARQSGKPAPSIDVFDYRSKR